jgi:acetoin utilization deacetylase AcuC-like enzyme
LAQPLRRWLRRLHQRLVPCAHPTVLYSGAYAVELPSLRADSRRAEHILTFLSMEGLIGRRDLSLPRLASFEQLGRVHDGAYLTSLTEPDGLVPMLGFAVSPRQAERVLAAQRAMTGGTVRAARLAVQQRATVINLGGGLHHAHRDRGHGFCLVNDVAVAVAELRARGFAERILVVDLDLHDGDGTRRIFAEDATVHTLSIHNQHWAEVEAVEATAVALGSGVGDEAYLAALDQHLRPLLERFRPGLVFYLAGADPADDDALGDWKVSAAGMLARDQRVIAELDRLPGRRPPLVVVMAGGYGTSAWRYSARFFGWLLAGEALEPPSTEEIILERYRFFAALVPPAQLSGSTGENELGLSSEDLLPAGSAAAAPRLLGFYTPQGVELALERYGFLGRLRGLGYESLSLELELDNPAGQTLSIYGDEAHEELLVELRLRREQHLMAGFSVLFVEWLLLQNPRGDFSPARPPLPGQKHPGLALLRDVVAIFMLICDRLRLDGIVFVPAHFHIAVQARSHAFFVAPEDQGRFQALLRDLVGSGSVGAGSVGAISRALEHAGVEEVGSGEVASWRPAPMVIPVSPRLRAELGGTAYRARVEAELARSAYRHADG